MGKPNVNINVGRPASNASHTYKTITLKPNIPLGLQMTESNARYVIKYNFEVGMNEVYADTYFSETASMVIDGVNYHWNILVSGIDNNHIVLTDDTIVFVENGQDVILPVRELTLSKDATIRMASPVAGDHPKAFKLKANAVDVPDNSMLVFEGGSINNGGILLNGCSVYPTFDSFAGNDIELVGLPKIGTQKWDADLGKPIWCNGEEWVDAMGNVIEPEQEAEEDNDDNN